MRARFFESKFTWKKLQQAINPGLYCSTVGALFAVDLNSCRPVFHLKLSQLNEHQSCVYRPIYMRMNKSYFDKYLLEKLCWGWRYFIVIKFNILFKAKAGYSTDLQGVSTALKIIVSYRPICITCKVFLCVPCIKRPLFRNSNKAIHVVYSSTEP